MIHSHVSPNDSDKKRISLDSKIKLKFYIRLYFFFIHNFRKLIEKTNSSGNFGFSKQQKKTILEQYFDEDINNINRLGSSADMFFIKPYFEHLCNNSYDDDCNNYRKYLNINLKENPDEISEQIVDQVRTYANKFHSLSVNDQFIEKIRKMLANKNQLSKEDFDAFSKYMEGFLKESGIKQFQDDIQDLDKHTQDIEAEYEAKEEELKSIPTKIEAKKKAKKEQVDDRLRKIREEQDEIVRLKEQLKKAGEDREQVSDIQFRIRDKENRMDEYTREKEAFENELKDLEEDKEKKDKEIAGKIKNLGEMQEKDKEELEKRKQKKYKENGESIYIKILRDSNIWDKYPSEKELKELIKNPENSIKLFEKFIPIAIGVPISETQVQAGGIKKNDKSKEKLKILLFALNYVKYNTYTHANKFIIKDLIEKVENELKKTNVNDANADDDADRKAKAMATRVVATVVTQKTAEKESAVQRELGFFGRAWGRLASPATARDDEQQLGGKHKRLNTVKNKNKNNKTRRKKKKKSDKINEIKKSNNKFKITKAIVKHL